MKITKRVFAIFLFIAVCFGMVNCATVFSGTNEKITINSLPEGADVKINGVSRGKTPLILKLDKKNAPYQVVLSKEGYKDSTYALDKNVGAGWIVLDCLTGFFELAVDAVTGAWYNVSPKTINATLEPNNN